MANNIGKSKMQAAPQNNNIFAPVHEAHSIEQVVFILQFDRPLNDVVFKKILENSATFEKELPAVSQLMPQFAISFGNPGTMPQNPPIGGVSYRKIAPNGTLDTELRIERNTITYLTTNYTRWNPTWEKANKFINQLISEYMAYARIGSVTLNYVDKYIWKGAPEDFHAAGLIDTDSNLISRNIFNVEDFWHSHTGAFYKIDDKVKRLLNFNVDALEEPILGKLHKVIALTTVITDMLDQPGYEILDYNTVNLIEYVDKIMQSMHDFSKVILQGTLTQDVQKRIGLV